MTEHETLEQAIHALQAEAVNFAFRWINDNNVRRDYLTSVQQYSRELQDAVHRHELSAAEAAQEAVEMRNRLMELSRFKLSDIGKAYSSSLKAQGRPLEALLEKYAQQFYKRPFSALNRAQQDTVFLEIVKSSGRVNPTVTVRSARLSRMGRGLLLVSVGVAAYNILTAENKVDAAGREAASLGGGMLGGAAGGAAAGLLCGPGAPVCVTIGVFVGGVAGALGADFAYGWFRQ
ncbi:hypothetical protein [Archangium sp.]|uniref:hypothetical protein n=1 Tax=Archangium sp. TaxID=1872627 RepID=UPI002D6DFB3E|nr:hypothetical protein [Archangium sp.]HYO53309.1 hypothetical protein [Archangium sp.]